MANKIYVAPNPPASSNVPIFCCWQTKGRGIARLPKCYTPAHLRCSAPDGGLWKAVWTVLSTKTHGLELVRNWMGREKPFWKR